MLITIGRILILPPERGCPSRSAVSLPRLLRLGQPRSVQQRGDFGGSIKMLITIRGSISVNACFGTLLQWIIVFGLIPAVGLKRERCRTAQAVTEVVV